MAEDMCRTSELTEIVPPGIGAVVLKELPAAGKQGIVYVIEGNPITAYTWNGTQFVSVGGGGDDSFIVMPGSIWTGDCVKTYGVVHRVNTGSGCFIGEQLGSGILGGVRINGRWFDVQDIACKYGNNEMGITLEGFEVSYSNYDIVAQKSIDCDDPAYAHGQTITPTLTVTWDGNTYSAPLPLHIIEMGG